jgi:hypothetical protein
VKVRTTIQPDVEVEVDEGELLDLKRQGLLIEDEQDKAESAKAAEAPKKKEG